MVRKVTPKPPKRLKVDTPPDARPVTVWEDGSRSRKVKKQYQVSDPGSSEWRKGRIVGSAMPPKVKRLARQKTK